MDISFVPFTMASLCLAPVLWAFWKIRNFVNGATHVVKTGLHKSNEMLHVTIPPPNRYNGMYIITLLSKDYPEIDNTVFIDMAHIFQNYIVGNRIVHSPNYTTGKLLYPSSPKPPIFYRRFIIFFISLFITFVTIGIVLQKGYKQLPPPV
jgi:hypothetical protein